MLDPINELTRFWYVAVGSVPVSSLCLKAWSCSISHSSSLASELYCLIFSVRAWHHYLHILYIHICPLSQWPQGSDFSPSAVKEKVLTFTTFAASSLGQTLFSVAAPICDLGWRNYWTFRASSAWNSEQSNLKQRGWIMLYNSNYFFEIHFFVTLSCYFAFNLISHLCCSSSLKQVSGAIHVSSEWNVSEAGL